MNPSNWQDRVFFHSGIINTQIEYQNAEAWNYRLFDEEIIRTESFRVYERLLQKMEGRFAHPITALDIGCGTGRYFSCFRKVQRLVGVDLSPHMLQQAKHPVRAEYINIKEIELIEANVFDPGFKPGETFHLIYSIGVLAEHAPLTRDFLQRVRTWLKPGGIFALTAIPRNKRSNYYKYEIAGMFLACWPLRIPLPKYFKELIFRKLGISGFAINAHMLRKIFQKSGLVLENIEIVLPHAYTHYWVVARH